MLKSISKVFLNLSTIDDFRSISKFFFYYTRTQKYFCTLSRPQDISLYSIRVELIDTKVDFSDLPPYLNRSQRSSSIIKSISKTFLSKISHTISKTRLIPEISLFTRDEFIYLPLYYGRSQVSSLLMSM